MMMMENNNDTTISAVFPVTFFDGEIELDMGTVQITPSLTFKAFQSIISQKLQISPHQITIYFQSQNPNPNPNYNYNYNHHRRRHPVTSKFDFKSICAPHVSNSSNFFWVVQKRSRRTRRRKNNINNNRVQFFSSNGGMINFNNNNNNPGENFSILRRGEFINEFEYFNKMNLLEKEKERYLMSMNLNSNVYNDLSFAAFFNGGSGGYNCNFSDDGVSSSGGGSSSAASGIGFCDVCFSYRSGADNTVPFHWCKNDAVTKVFRSPAGPIAPPKKIDFLD